MQRRVAAIYFVLLLVISAGAYAYTGIAEKPHVSIEGPAYTAGDNITANGTVYTVNAVGKTGGGGGGGHGGGGEATFVGNITWVADSPVGRSGARPDGVVGGGDSPVQR